MISELGESKGEDDDDDFFFKATPCRLNGPTAALPGTFGMFEW